MADQSLPHIVLARPMVKGAALREIEASLPKGLRTIWSSDAGDADGLATLVQRALLSSPQTLADRIGEALARDLRRRLLDGLRLPKPQRFGKIRLFPARVPPSIGDAFVGRDDDLWRLHAVLRPTRTGPGNPVAIEAIGGVGKTRLAIEYVHRYGPLAYKGGIFWVDGEGDVETQLHGILSLLQPTASRVDLRKEGVDIAAVLAQALRAQGTKRILFVVDGLPLPGASLQSIAGKTIALRPARSRELIRVPRAATAVGSRSTNA